MKRILFLLILAICPLSLWAQTPCSDIRVHVYDTICEGEEYDFNGRTLNYEGIFYDTIPRINDTCDSIIFLHLAVLSYPTGRIRAIAHCADSQAYRLVSSTPDYYYSWSSDPEDPSLLGQEHADQVWVRPSVTTTYHLYIDHRQTPLCPATGELTINPLEPVVAQMHISVSELTYDNMIFTAEDFSLGTRESHYGGWSGRLWYINGVRQANQQEFVTFEAKPWWGDSVEVKMVGISPTCADSVTQIIPFLHVSLYFPNIFTPGKEPNHLFKPTTQGILTYELSIYDRRGVLVFHTTDPSEGWDGTKHGTPCPSGAYTYHCRYSELTTPNGWQQQAGSVTLIR